MILVSPLRNHPSVGPRSPTVARVSSACAVLGLLLGHLSCAPGESTGSTQPIHEAAADGRLASVTRLLSDGADPNALDELGRTPLHLAGMNGHGQTAQALLDGGADPALKYDGKTAADLALANGHDETAAILGAAGGPPPGPTAQQSGSSKFGRPLNPALKYRTPEAFGAAIGAPAVMIPGDNVLVFAPASLETNARTVQGYLDRAYAVLRDIVGIDTDYMIVVYHFPRGHKDAFGGTSNCTIWYDDTNLRFDQHEEWRAHRVPHLSGYIEEIAHNFVHATKAQFGWEMAGWSLGVIATAKVGNNPTFQRSLHSTRATQAETHRRYRQAGNVFPADIPPNLVDRIHAHLLAQCEQTFGPRFWQDFFAEVRKEREPLANAVSLGDGDAIRNERYRITIECFDRLQGLEFRKLLKENGISLVTDVESLHPTELGWNRRLQ